MPRAHAAAVRRTSEPLVVTLFDAPPPAAGSPEATAQAAAAQAEPTAPEPTQPKPREKPKPKPREKPKLDKAEPQVKAKVLPEPEPEPAEEPEPEPEASPAEATEPTAAAAEPAAPSSTASKGQGDPSATRTGANGNGDDASAKPSQAVVTPRKVEVLPFGPGMTRPELLKKVDPVYTREARQAKVQGLFLAKCVITTKGTLQKCRVVKGLPLMNDAILKAVSEWRYSPVQYQGKAVNVDYLIKVRLSP